MDREITLCRKLYAMSLTNPVGYNNQMDSLQNEMKKILQLSDLLSLQKQKIRVMKLQLLYLRTINLLN